MKGNIRMAAALVGVALSAAAARAQCPAGGCPDGGGGKKATSGLDMTGHNNYGLYDRCWFQRYTNLAHRAVNRAMTPQVQNGHVLDQTVWNHMFDQGTDQLNPLGQSHLQYVSRRRPEVDRTVYLATAMDLQYDPACPERYAGARQELDSLRVAAVQKYLVALNAGRCSDFQVLLHDPADVSISTQGPAFSVQQMYSRFRGGLGGGGAAGPSGSVGGFSSAAVGR